MRPESWRAAGLISSLVAAGTALVLSASSGSAWSSLGQAMLSGGIVGSVFVYVESSLAGAAERRSEREGLVRQLTLTTNLVGIELEGQALAGLYLPNKDLTAARLRRADLSGTVLLFSSFVHADLSEAVLERADLGGATFEHGRLVAARCRGAVFLDANLSHVDARLADLREADLSFAVLRGTNLRRADLRNAVLVNADLRGADLAGADLAGADLTDVLFDAATAWPGEAPDQIGPALPVWDPSIDLAGWLLRRAELREAIQVRRA